jgi:hypothetical protein
MNDHHSEDLTELRSLAHEIQAPAELEERVISSLKKKGLIHTPRRKTFLKGVAAIAACVILFSAGLLAGLNRSQSRNQVTLTESTFVLFLIQSPSYKEAATPELQKQRIIEYGNWARKLRTEGTPINGVKLQDQASFIGAPPQLYESYRIAGYFLIEARDFEQALAIAKTCPHARYGGEIEVRRIHKV